jgi:hypothetical protein
MWNIFSQLESSGKKKTNVKREEFEFIVECGQWYRLVTWDDDTVIHDGNPRCDCGAVSRQAAVSNPRWSFWM